METVQQVGSILKRPTTPIKSPRRAKKPQSPGVRKPLGDTTKAVNNTQNVPQEALKPALKNATTEVPTKGILKDPKQTNKRKRSSDFGQKRRISFGSVEWSTFAKHDPVTPTKDRAKKVSTGRESIDFNFELNLQGEDVSIIEENGGADEFSASSIFNPSEDDFSQVSGVSMISDSVEQRPAALSQWTAVSKAFASSPAAATEQTSSSPPTKKRKDLRTSLDAQMTATLMNTNNFSAPDQNEFDEEDRTDVIFSLVSFNHGAQQGEETAEQGETMDFTVPVGMINSKNGSIKDKTENLRADEEDDRTDTVFNYVSLGKQDEPVDEEEDDEDDKTDIIFKSVSFGMHNTPNTTNMNVTNVHEKSMDMTQLHRGAIIDYRKEGEEGEEEEQAEEEQVEEEEEKDMKSSTEEVEYNDETMDFTALVDRSVLVEKENEDERTREMEENPFAKRDKICNSPLAPSVKVFVQEEERKDTVDGSADDKTDMIFDMVSFKRDESEVEEKEEVEEEQEQGSFCVSLPTLDDSVLNGDDDDRTDTIFQAGLFARRQSVGATEEDGEESMMETRLVSPSRGLASTPKQQTPARTPKQRTPARTPKQQTPARTPAKTPKQQTPARTPAKTPKQQTPARTPKPQTPAKTPTFATTPLRASPRKTPAKSPMRTPRRTPRKATGTPSALSKEITTPEQQKEPAGFNPFAKSSLVQNSPIVVGNNSMHNNSMHNTSMHNTSVHETSTHTVPLEGNQTDMEADEGCTTNLFSLISSREGEKGAPFAGEAEHPSPIHQQDASFSSMPTARGVLVFGGEDKTAELSPAAPSGGSPMASPFAHRAINDSDYDPFATSSPLSASLLPQTPVQAPRSVTPATTPLSSSHLSKVIEDSPGTSSTRSSDRFSFGNDSFALTENDLVFSTGSPASSPQQNNSLLDWDPSSPVPASALSSPAPSSPAPSSLAPPSPAPSSVAPSSSPAPSIVVDKSFTQTPSTARFSTLQTPTSARIVRSTPLQATTPVSRRESNPFSEEVESSLRKLRICTQRLNDKISIHSTPITPRSRTVHGVRSSLGGEGAKATNRPIPVCEFMRLVGVESSSSSSSSSSTPRRLSVLKTPQKLSVTPSGGKRRKSNPNSRLTPRMMMRMTSTSQAENWVTLMLDDSSQKHIPYQLVAAFAEGPQFSSLEKQLADTRRQTQDLQKRLQTLEQEISANNPSIFQDFSKATGVKKSILSDRLNSCYQKCLSQAKLKWLSQSATTRKALQEDLNNHREMIKEDLVTYQKHIDELDSLQSSPPPPPAPSPVRAPSSVAEDSIVPEENQSIMRDMEMARSTSIEVSGYSDPQKIEMWERDMYNITVGLQPWTLTSVTTSQLQFEFSSFCHVRVSFGGVLEDGGRVVTKTAIMLGKDKKDSLPYQEKPMEWVKMLVENSPAYRMWATLKTTKALPSLLTLFSTTVRRAAFLVKEIDSLRLLHHQPYILEISPNQQHTSLPLLTKVTFLRKNEPYFSVLFALSAEYPFAPLHHCVLGIGSSSPLKSHVQDMIVSVSHAESGVGSYPLSCIVNALASFVGSQ